MSHGIVKCSQCGVVIAQCRCWEHNLTTYDLCSDCRSRPVDILNQKSWTPANVLASIDPGELEHVCVIAKMKDGTWDTISSCVKFDTLSTFAMVMQRRVLREMDRSAE